MGRPNPIRILLVDDNHTFLASEAMFLSTVPEVCVVGQAASGEEAILMTQALRPDLILMDLTMPLMEGFETSRRIKQLPSAPRIIAVTGHDDAEYRKRVRKDGLEGFVCKTDLVSKLMPLVELVFAEQQSQS